MNGAEALVHTLADGGVEVCFANPGTSEMHIVAALDRTARMRCVLGLFEGVVTGAADGYARMAGKPAATLLHLAPGLANGCANIHNAKKAGTPMVNIIGDHATWHAGLDAPLSADVEGAARPFSHWVRTAQSSARVASDAADALAAAQAWPGRIATLILPGDVAWHAAGNPAQPVEPRSFEAIGDDQIEVAAKILEARQKTLILLGFHVLCDPFALELAGAIAGSCGADLMAPTSNRRIERGAGRVSIECIPYPVDLAIERLHGYANCILIEAKEPVAFFGYPGKPSRVLPASCRLQILARPEQCGRDALARLAERLDSRPSAAQIQTLHRPELVRAGAIDPASIARNVAALLPENAIIADEGINCGRQVYPETRGCPPHSWMRVTGGAIGIGMPMAVGAAIACPDRKVVNLQADGSAMYTLQALWTQAHEGLGIVTVIFSNRGYESLKGELFKVGANPGRTALDMLEIDRPALDWVSLSRGMGVPATRVSDNDAFATALSRALAAEGPQLIEAIVA